MVKKVLCEICGNPIPPERLTILPETRTCVKCSHTEPYKEIESLGLNLFEEQEHESINMEDYEFE